MQQFVAVGVNSDEVRVRFLRAPAAIGALDAGVVEMVQFQRSGGAVNKACCAGDGARSALFVSEPLVATGEPSG